MDRPTRPLSSDEKRLLTLLLSSRPEDARLRVQVDEIRVQEMADGGMGSLRFEGEGTERHRSTTVASAQFRDADGTAVLVSLDLDQNGALFELDVWKVDFSSLQQIPDNSHIQVE
jgi:hypothetical protein